MLDYIIITLFPFYKQNLNFSYFTQLRENSYVIIFILIYAQFNIQQYTPYPTSPLSPINGSCISRSYNVRLISSIYHNCSEIERSAKMQSIKRIPCAWRVLRARIRYTGIHVLSLSLVIQANKRPRESGNEDILDVISVYSRRVLREICIW